MANERVCRGGQGKIGRSRGGRPTRSVTGRGAAAARAPRCDLDSDSEVPSESGESGCGRPSGLGPDHLLRCCSRCRDNETGAPTGISEAGY